MRVHPSQKGPHNLGTHTHVYKMPFNHHLTKKEPFPSHLGTLLIFAKFLLSLPLSMTLNCQVFKSGGGTRPHLRALTIYSSLRGRPLVGQPAWPSPHWSMAWFLTSVGLDALAVSRSLASAHDSPLNKHRPKSAWREGAGRDRRGREAGGREEGKRTETAPPHPSSGTRSLSRAKKERDHFLSLMPVQCRVCRDLRTHSSSFSIQSPSSFSFTQRMKVAMWSPRKRKALILQTKMSHPSFSLASLSIASHSLLSLNELQSSCEDT